MGDSREKREALKANKYYCSANGGNLQSSHRAKPHGGTFTCA